MAAPLGPLTGQVRALLGRAAHAEVQRLLAQSPSGADRSHAEGLYALARGNSQSALTHLQSAFAAQPDSGWIACDLGRAWLAANQAHLAVEVLEQAVVLEPRHLQAWLSLGLAAETAGQLGRADTAWQHAATLDPRQPAAPYNLGNLAYRQGLVQAARRHYEESLRRQPAFAAAWSALGSVEHDACRWKDAEKALRRAIELDPGWSAPRETLAHVLLGRACWQEGWQCYAWRAARVGVGAHVARPAEVTAVPSVAQLHGLNVLIAGEQGLGDVLFFLRWLPQLKAAAAEVGFWGDERLFALLKGAPISRFVPQSQAAPPGWVPLRSGDLPLILDPAGRNLPAPLALTGPDTTLLAQLKAELSALGPPPYIGLTWRAGTAGNREALAKQVPTGELGSALAEINGTLISVQRLPESAELTQLQEAAGRPVADLSAHNADLPRIAALMQQLDHYIAVSNTNVHLRAGYGKSSMVLVPRPPEWRWGQQGDISPWYPGSTVLRQQEDGWQSALSRLQSLLH